MREVNFHAHFLKEIKNLIIVDLFQLHMNQVKLVTNIILTVVVIALAYYLYSIIQEPIIFERQKKVRFERTVKQLKDLRQIQLAYKDLNGKFANNFKDLINTITQDSFPLIMAIGVAPDSLTEEQAVKRGIITRDTTLIPMVLKAFPLPEDYDKPVRPYLDSMKRYVAALPYLPYNETKQFDIDAGEITKNTVTIQVFEISAPEHLILAGLNDDLINDNYALRVGSMIEGTYTGNWE